MKDTGFRMEEWRLVEGYGSNYEASTYGKIRNVWTGRELKLQKNYLGYLITRLYDSKKGKTVSVSRTIASTFLVKKDGLEVNHKDGNKENNRLDNLEYVTRGYNIKHAFTNGLRKADKGQDNKNSKLTNKQVLEIRSKYKRGVNQHNTGYGLQRLANEYNVGQTTISHIIKNDNWTHI